MIEKIKNIIKEKLQEYYLKQYEREINIIIEEPKRQDLGDISVPMFFVVKELKKPMAEITSEAGKVILSSSDLIKEINVIGAFINVIVDKVKLSKAVIKNIMDSASAYGNSSIGENQTVVLDYSSPNIAKSFSIGHLRSTMIGNSLKLIMQKCGYKTVSINYLGDWGTQFGKMIVAINKWGNVEEIKKDSINQLTQLYVKFHDEAEKNPSLENEAREAFRKVELGDVEYLEMWKWIREESLKESKEIYDLLEVDFDSHNGESFYNDKMDVVLDELEAKNLLKEDQGAMIVDLGESLPPALIKRKDGGTLYMTRDIAAVLYRMKEYHFDKALYIVGNEQKLHFTQLKTVLSLMGKEYANTIEHVNFGLYLSGGKKMSTRRGKVVKLYDVLQRAIDLSLNLINEKNPNLENKEQVAKYVGVGAIVFNDLKNHRTLDVDFDIEQSVKFEGQTGPYLQYTGVRIASILKDAEINFDAANIELFEKPHYFELVKLLSSFGQVIIKASKEYAPSVIAKYLLSVAQSFNKFYSLEKINVEDETIKNTNLALSLSVRIVLNEGLRLLGMHYLDQM